MLDVGGLTFEPEDELPPGWIPTEAVVIFVGVDAEGHPDTKTRATPGLLAWQTIGLLTVASDQLRHYIVTED